MPNKSQNSDSVERAFTENEGALKRFLERFFYTSHEAEDILQETFLQTYQIEKKQEIRSPKSYLFKVARNLALKELTKKSRQIVDYIEEIAPDEFISNTASIEDKIQLDERLMVFSKALDILPPQCRKAFLLRKVYGLSQKEIGRRLGISVSTVEKHLANGLQRCNIYMHERGIDNIFASTSHNKQKESEDRIKEAK